MDNYTIGNRADEKSMQELLEGMLDRRGLGEILLSLSNIAHEKSAHLAENWQDANGAKQWTKTAKQIERWSIKANSISPL